MDLSKYPGTVGDCIRVGLQLNGELESCYSDLHGVRTRIMSNSSRVADAVRRFLAAFPAEEDSDPDIEVFLFTVDRMSDALAPVEPDAVLLHDWGRIRILHSGNYRYEQIEDRARVVADVESCVMAGFAGEELLQSDWLISNVFFYPLWAQLLKQRGLFPLHAAGLVSEGSAGLFLGRSGSGKSTLSIHLVRQGYGLLSDDTVFLREKNGAVEALSFPEEINVSEQTVELIPELANVSRFTPNELRQKSSFSIEELYPGCIVDSAVPSVLIFPELADSRDTVIRPMSASEALTLSLRYALFFMDPATTARGFELLSMLANQSTCYSMLTGTDQEQLGQAVDGLLRRNLRKTS